MTSGTDERTSAPAKWGKVIDNRKCIGCHACTVACKQEYEVPLGVNRTYVKQVEAGTFPNVRRHFQVTRCNQCDDPPCVEICPTTAMFQRADGIVDFDRSRCIGCKACIAACPYDAIYIDPVSHSAEKCNFCTNRVDRSLQPACVVVCPTQAIFAGDLNDPHSQVSLLVSNESTRVRKPEKKTEPKLFYVGASDYTLIPGAAKNPATFRDSPSREPLGPPGSRRRPAWAGPIPATAGPVGLSATKSPRKVNNPANTSAAALLSYDNAHEVPWNWVVSA